MSPRVGIGIFIFKDKKFLMGQRKGAHGEGSWSVPGGHLEFGETIEEAVRREALEETGLIVKNVKAVGITNDIFQKEGKHYLTIWTISNWGRGEPEVREPDKFLKIDWRNFNNLPKPLFLPWQQLLKSEFVSEIKRSLQAS